MALRRWLREHWLTFAGAVLFTIGAGIVVSALITGEVRELRRFGADDILRDADPQGFYLTLLIWVAITAFFGLITAGGVYQDVRIRRAVQRKSSYGREHSIIISREDADKTGSRPD